MEPQEYSAEQYVQNGSVVYRRSYEAEPFQGSLPGGEFRGPPPPPPGGHEAQQVVVPPVPTPVKKTYAPPRIPVTPSVSINNMLEARCNKTFTSPIKYAIAVYVCTVFSMVTTLYKLINKKKPAESHRFWAISCGIVAVAAVFMTWLVYSIMMASGVLIHLVVKYSFIMVGLAGVGLGVGGALVYDKEGIVPVSAPEPVPRKSQ